MKNIYLFAIDPQTHTKHPKTKKVGALLEGEAVASIAPGLRSTYNGSVSFVFIVTPDQARKLIKELRESLDVLE